MENKNEIKPLSNFFEELDDSILYKCGICGVTANETEMNGVIDEEGNVMVVCPGCLKINPKRVETEEEKQLFLDKVGRFLHSTIDIEYRDADIFSDNPDKLVLFDKSYNVIERYSRIELEKADVL